MTLLDVRDAQIRYRLDGGNEVYAVDGVSFSINSGETFGLVGESGCGKTTLGKAIISLLDANGYVADGAIRFRDPDLVESLASQYPGRTALPGEEVGNGDFVRVEDGDRDPEGNVRVTEGYVDLVAAPNPAIRQVRWAEISTVPQASMSGLNPVYKVGDQIVEAIRHHQPETTEEEAHEHARDLLDRVGVEPQRADDYAHQLSGGMKQRAMIAMALACDPDLIIADEPTTALDVIVQDQVLHELEELQAELDVSFLIISHDISVIAETCDRVGVMYGGKLMEIGKTEDVFDNPANPYTMGLKNSFPNVQEDTDRLVSIPGTPPTLQDPADGCQFRSRCPFATPECDTEHPPLKAVSQPDGHGSACYHLDKLGEMRTDAQEEETWL